MPFRMSISHGEQCPVCDKSIKFYPNIGGTYGSCLVVHSHSFTIRHSGEVWLTFPSLNGLYELFSNFWLKEAFNPDLHIEGASLFFDSYNDLFPHVSNIKKFSEILKTYYML